MAATRTAAAATEAEALIGGSAKPGLTSGVFIGILIGTIGFGELAELGC